MISEIVKNKKLEVRISREKFPLESFKHKLVPSKIDFKKAISKEGRLNLIAEIKRKSPSNDAISEPVQTDFENILDIYDRHADAISVLTDKRFFAGSLEDLKNASSLTALPLLRKDFIIDEYQIYESRFYGANAILLIASQLSCADLSAFIGIAKRYKMHCLVEVHTKKDIETALNSKSEIMGINNRDLGTLKIDKNTTLEIIRDIPKGKVIVSESGISSKEHVKIIRDKVNAILVGSFFMKSKNLEEDIKKLGF